MSNENSLDNKEYQKLVKLQARHQTLVRNVFSTADGRELLELWMDEYVHGDLYGPDDRAMIYRIGQRDLVLEIEHAVKRRIEE